MEAMPAVSSRSKKYPKSLLLVSLRDPRPIRHPDKCSKLENDATCGLAGLLVPIKWPKAGLPLAAVTLVVAVLCAGIAIYIAQPGGQVRHPEFQTSQKPNP